MTFIVAALGYFVDIYDLLLFGVVRIESLRGIGIADEQLLDSGVLLINYQMAGMLVGGLFWGVLADRKGRTVVLMASILIYSLANLANAFVDSIATYAICRFVAGLGLSGEVGSAVTLISESAKANTRTLWTTLLTAFGLLGAVTAGFVGDYFTWQVAYLVGGSMGLVLLLLRFQVLESSIFNKSSVENRGRIDLLVRSKERFGRYSACVLLGVPIWFTAGILMTFAPELTEAIGYSEVISASHALLYCYSGLFIGDLLCGLMSHWVKSRRFALAAFLALNGALTVVYLSMPAMSSNAFYMLCGVLGLSAGYWSVYITLVSESFGTNIRATAVTTVTNCMRGSVVLMTSGIQALSSFLTLPQSALLIGILVLLAAVFSLIYLSETFGKKLDYTEC
ncbi:MAG: MFS transporter, partial [Deltaproteobacteria bacterium]|nr:MFS transporter [Deltaproteobacteria bacterium]